VDRGDQRRKDDSKGHARNGLMAFHSFTL